MKIKGPSRPLVFLVPYHIIPVINNLAFLSLRTYCLSMHASKSSNLARIGLVPVEAVDTVLQPSGGLLKSL